MFASHYTPNEQHKVERLRVERQGLVSFKFGTTRELIEAAEALEACLRKGQQGKYGLVSKRMQSIPLADSFYLKKVRDISFSSKNRGVP